MEFKPVYDFLTNSTIPDMGIEYFSKSKKAFSIAWLLNQEEKKSEAYGFLFDQVESISQKPKTEKISRNLGIENMGLLNFIYYKQHSDDKKIFVLNSEYNYIVVIAKKVELIRGVTFM